MRDATIEHEWLTAEQATARLGVKRETLWAYASRGQVAVAPGGGSTRVYSRRDVELLASRGRLRRPTTEHQQPSKERPLETAISTVQQGRLYLRGLPVTDLATRTSFEQLSEWLWSQRRSRRGWPAPERHPGAADEPLGYPAEGCHPLDAVIAAIARLASADAQRHDRSGAAVAAAARRILVHGMDLAGVRSADGGAAGGRDADRPMDERALRAMGVDAPDPELRALVGEALILVAENGMSVPTTVVRACAAAGADLYAAVSAGLAVSSCGRPGSYAHRVDMALRQGAPDQGPLPGFAALPGRPAEHERARYLLRRYREVFVGSPRLEVLSRYLELGAERGHETPGIDLAKGALGFLLDSPPGVGGTVLSIARISGWTAHFIEERQMSLGAKKDIPISPRLPSIYTGPLPRNHTRKGKST